MLLPWFASTSGGPPWTLTSGNLSWLVLSVPATSTHTAPSAGLLQPLSIKHRTWSCISIDFVTGLPLSEGNTTILTIIDRFSKAVHLLSLPKLPSALESTDLLVQHVFYLHGIPDDIVSDRDNSLVSSAMGLSPFMVTHGFQPPLFTSQEVEVAVPSAQAQFHRTPRVWREARAALERTTAKNRRLADRHHIPAPEYQARSGCRPGTFPSMWSPGSWCHATSAPISLNGSSTPVLFAWHCQQLSRFTPCFTFLSSNQWWTAPFTPRLTPPVLPRVLLTATQFIQWRHSCAWVFWLFLLRILFSFVSLSVFSFTCTWLRGGSTLAHLWTIKTSP